jgi:hypothetical protein
MLARASDDTSRETARTSSASTWTALDSFGVELRRRRRTQSPFRSVAVRCLLLRYSSSAPSNNQVSNTDYVFVGLTDNIQDFIAAHGMGFLSVQVLQFACQRDFELL